MHTSHGDANHGFQRIEAENDTARLGATMSDSLGDGARDWTILTELDAVVVVAPLDILAASGSKISSGAAEQCSHLVARSVDSRRESGRQS